MRLCFLIASLEAGGAERVLTGLANFLAERGDDIHIITFRPRGTIPFYTLSPKITLHQLGYMKRGFRLTLPFRVIHKSFLLRRIIKKLKPNIIVSFIDFMNVVALLTLKGLPYPLIISERVDPRGYSIGKVAHFLRRITYPWAQALVVQTKDIAQYFSSTSPCIHVIPNPIPSFPSEFSPNLESHRIINVGRLDPQKGQDLLITAFSKIHQRFPQWTLTIWGEGKERPCLEKLVKDLNLTTKVFLPGLSKEISQELKKSSIFAFPSRFEGFPNALAEAMALGLPCVASRCSGVTDLIEDGDNGFLIPLNDADALSKVLEKLMEDISLRHLLGSKAQKVKEDYALEKIYSFWDQLFQNVRR